jgi:hypothetical protein
VADKRQTANDENEQKQENKHRTGSPDTKAQGTMNNTEKKRGTGYRYRQKGHRYRDNEVEDHNRTTVKQDNRKTWGNNSRHTKAGKTQGILRRQTQATRVAHSVEAREAN